MIHCERLSVLAKLKVYQFGQAYKHKHDRHHRHTSPCIFQGMSFPREKHQSVRVVAMSAARGVLRPCRARAGWAGRRPPPEMADAPPLFAIERTRYRTENRPRGALIFFF